MPPMLQPQCHLSTICACGGAVERGYAAPRCLTQLSAPVKIVAGAENRRKIVEIDPPGLGVLRRALGGTQAALQVISAHANGDC